MELSKTNGQVFEWLIERALVGKIIRPIINLRIFFRNV